MTKIELQEVWKDVMSKLHENDSEENKNHMYNLLNEFHTDENGEYVYGIDGLNDEFYRTFCDEFYTHEDVYDILMNDCWKNEEKESRYSEPVEEEFREEYWLNYGDANHPWYYPEEFCEECDGSKCKICPIEKKSIDDDTEELWLKHRFIFYGAYFDTEVLK